MAQYVTHKTGKVGKVATLERKNARARKYADAPPLASTAQAVGARLVGGEDK